MDGGAGDTMSRTATVSDTRSDDRAEILREATTMVLYVSVVEIAELAALPEGRFSDGHVTGTVGGALLAVVWGTAIGLALAHWFAFRVAAPAFRGQRVTTMDTRIGVAQVAGALFVATISSLPVLFLDDSRARQLTSDIIAVLIGVISYRIARATGRSRPAAVLYGLTAVVLGVLVAFVKSTLAGH
jgi:hypothetical protein